MLLLPSSKTKGSLCDWMCTEKKERGRKLRRIETKGILGPWNYGMISMFSKGAVCAVVRSGRVSKLFSVKVERVNNLGFAASVATGLPL